MMTLTSFHPGRARLSWLALALTLLAAPGALAGDRPEPQTFIDEKPEAVTTSTTADFVFRSNVPRAEFWYSFDGEDYQRSTGTLSREGLAVGVHDIWVYAHDLDTGATDRSPAYWMWTVEEGQPPVDAGSPGEDAGTVDAGSPGQDAGTVDAGTSGGQDAGSAPDAGTSGGQDAGTAPDAGTSGGQDAGSSGGGTDAGSPGGGQDAGSPGRTDAGSPGGGQNAGSPGGSDAGTPGGGTDAGSPGGVTDAGTSPGGDDAGSADGGSPDGGPPDVGGEVPSGDNPSSETLDYLGGGVGCTGAPAPSAVAGLLLLVLAIRRRRR
ncbi:MAG TPA: hypothetical protein VE153_04945 [Myxococcus sp.]|nr:hypothetical protein [Myxococcus sp.]